jgi:glycosyltransferase involved in cell wall biosynthesis
MLQNTIFVTNPDDLNATVQGGVQRCSHEFLAIVQELSSETTIFEMPVSTSTNYRIGRRLGTPYMLYDTENALEIVSQMSKKGVFNVVFNKAETYRVAARLKEIRPDANIVVLSHGADSGDMLHECASTEVTGLRDLTGTFRLGWTLIVERKLRRSANLKIVVLSQEEQVLERWLGSTKTHFLPRKIVLRESEWHPVPNVFGFVGTLNHPPNFDALEQVLLGLEAVAPDIKVEVVGGPAAFGEQLAGRFSSVNYLGRLTDAEVVNASRRWSAFLNPVFWLSRGASFKLATALELGLPIISTLSGARGYKIPSDCLALVDDAADAFIAQMKLFVQQPLMIKELRETLLASKTSLIDDSSRLAAFKDFLAKA